MVGEIEVAHGELAQMVEVNVEVVEDSVERAGRVFEAWFGRSRETRFPHHKRPQLHSHLRRSVIFLSATTMVSSY
jgi:hypothetical protein